ncbi:MAG: hypothetical protein DLM53_07890 [Candidatus Eremiobacter antarcticus]|nr:S9 family peptidase [Candidatus Eremiobacteraeota bacterium]PZR61722.1 MAG: hypothetical protein DLM53_07890 [Candidatus Eremiobacter sp. RRmetagenome_bin22]
MSFQRCAAGLSFTVLALIVFSQVCAGRAVQPEDLYKLAFVAGAQISHDGKHIAFLVTKIHGPKNEYRSNVWLADVASGAITQLTRGDSDENPTWSPDDRWLAFASGRSEKSQIYRISLSGGEAERLTNLPNGANSPVWSHDGQRIAFQSATKNSKRKTKIDWHATGFTPEDAQKTSDVRILDVLHFRENGAGETWTRHSHIWVMHADGSHQQQLTSGTQWSENAAAWSPDDRTLYFTSYRSVDPTLFRDDIYTVPSGGGAMRKLPLTHKSNEQPTFAKDGKRLWFFGASEPDPAGYAALVNADVGGHDERIVVPENTVAFGDAVLTDVKEGGDGCGPLFAPAEKWFIADVSVPGGTSIEKFDAQSGKSQTLVSQGDEILDCSLSDDGSRIAYVASDGTHPAEVFLYDAKSGASRQLSDVNKRYLESVDLSKLEHFTVTDRAGFPVHAWFMRPPQAVAGRRYPTLLEIHGGPATEFGNSFFHEMQYFASLGYNVVFSDPRGSVGFGYPFEAALSRNWGDPMFEDVTAVIDAACKRPEVDAARLGVLGGSYGGYATLWVIGHTQRFRAAVAERVVSNMTTGQLDVDFAGENSTTRSYGNAWDHAALFWYLSPLKYVKNVTTPVMMIHSDEDIRTPIGETLQEYSALKILGRTAELVQFPRDNHDLTRNGEPLHRVERLHLIADWFKKYLKP